MVLSLHNTGLSYAATLAEGLQEGHAVLDPDSETHKWPLSLRVHYSRTIT